MIEEEIVSNCSNDYTRIAAFQDSHVSENVRIVGREEAVAVHVVGWIQTS